MPSTVALEQEFVSRGSISTAKLLYSTDRSYDANDTAGESGPFTLAMAAEKTDGDTRARLAVIGSRGIYSDSLMSSGTNGNAGEVGHLRMAADGPVGYGKRGSFEGFCSGGGLKQLGQMRAIQALKEGRHPLYCQTEADLPTVTAKTIADAADAGDADAIEVYRYCGEQLGRGLSILIDLFNPEAIVIGSIFTRSENLLREEAERIIRKEALPMSAAVCSIRTAQLGNAIGDYAAIAVAEEARREKQ